MEKGELGLPAEAGNGGLQGRRHSAGSADTTMSAWSEMYEDGCWQKLKGIFGGAKKEPERRPIELFVMPASPRCRAVLMTARHLNIPLRIRKIDIFRNEHLGTEFAKINPMHTLPTIVDGDFVLWESGAIMAYLSNKYATYDSIYPSEPESRAIVDRLLYFEMNELYRSIQDFVNPQLFKGKPPDIDLENVMTECLAHMELCLVNNRYVAGHSLTVADFATLSSITHLELIDYKIKGYPMIQDWLRKLKNRLPYYYEVNQGPIDELKAAVKSGEIHADLLASSIWTAKPTITEHDKMSKQRAGKPFTTVGRNRVRVKPTINEAVCEKMTPLHI